MSKPFVINIVCTGNSCRSPIAEALLRKSLQEAGKSEGVRIESSGISAVDGDEASEGALQMVEERGASLDGFTSTRLTREVVDRTDLFLVMEGFHRDFMEEMFPDAADRVRLFRQYLEPAFSQDIPDPVGGDERVFSQVTRMIETAIRSMVDDWDAIHKRFYEQRQLVVAIGADHRGFANKEQLKNVIAQAGFMVVDCGTRSEESCDHPDYAFQVGQLVSYGAADRGILICGSGHGMVISSNKVPGVRSVLPINSDHARLSRQHNNANVLALASDFFSFEEIREISLQWLAEPFLGSKYQRRINKITEFERLQPC